MIALTPVESNTITSKLQRCIFFTDLNRSKVRGSFLLFEIIRVHLPCYVVQLTNALRIIAFVMDIKRFATAISHTF